MSKKKIKIFNDRIINIRCHFSPVSSYGLCNGVDITMHPDIPDLFTIRMFNAFTFSDMIDRVFEEFSFSQKPDIHIILVDTPDDMKKQIIREYDPITKENIIKVKKEIHEKLMSFKTDKCELTVTSELF